MVVYRFMTATGVEEKMYSRQIFKDSLNKQTIGKENDPSRYFTSSDLYELFKTGDFTRAKVCDDFNELHGTLEDKLYQGLADGQELTAEQSAVLQHKEHIKRTISEIIDISSHDLVFSKKTERLNENDADYAHLNQEVRTAKELLRRETEAGAAAAAAAGGGGRTQELDIGILSAKQKLLTQKYGTEFLPLGSQFNRYRDGAEKFEFRRPKPKSPVKLVSLDDDDDDDIQWVNNDKNGKSMTSLGREQSSTSSLKSIREQSTSSLMRIPSSTSSLRKEDSASSLTRSVSNKSVSIAPSPIRGTRSPAKAEMVDLSHDLSMMSVDGPNQESEDENHPTSSPDRSNESGQSENNSQSENGNESEGQNENEDENENGDQNEDGSEEDVQREENRLSSDEDVRSSDESDESVDDQMNNQLNESNLLSSDDSDLDEVLNSFNMSVRIDDTNRSQRGNKMDDSSIIILD